jgi:uncharacterized membrane protein YhaH (DUF805 family)
MTFQESIKTCFTKYADFSGRASRSEYWWFILFIFLGGFVLSFVSFIVYAIFVLATIIPSISAATRRLHDTGRSGWWQLIVLVPLVGWIIAIVFLAQESKSDAAYY